MTNRIAATDYLPKSARREFPQVQDWLDRPSGRFGAVGIARKGQPASIPGRSRARPTRGRRREVAHETLTILAAQMAKIVQWAQ